MNWGRRSRIEQNILIGEEEEEEEEEEGGGRGDRIKVVKNRVYLKAAADDNIMYICNII